MPRLFVASAKASALRAYVLLKFVALSSLSSFTPVVDAFIAIRTHPLSFTQLIDASVITRTCPALLMPLVYVTVATRTCPSSSNQPIMTPVVAIGAAM